MFNTENCYSFLIPRRESLPKLRYPFLHEYTVLSYVSICYYYKNDIVLQKLYIFCSLDITNNLEIFLYNNKEILRNI